MFLEWIRDRLQKKLQKKKQEVIKLKWQKLELEKKLNNLKDK